MRWLVCVVVLAGCQLAGADPDPLPAPKKPPPTRFERDMLLRFHMHENYDLVRAIEKLLVRGKLDETRGFAKAIAEAPDDLGLVAWTRQAAAVHERATALANATTIDDGCRRLARLAEACASCHVDAGVVPEFDPQRPAPADQLTIGARMARHLWATDRMWEGIVGGADESWRRGLDVLAASPLPTSELSGERAGFARQLQRQADQARRDTRAGLADRTRAYGEILTTCAGCHMMKPPPGAM